MLIYNRLWTQCKCTHCIPLHAGRKMSHFALKERYWVHALEKIGKIAFHMIQFWTLLEGGSGYYDIYWYIQHFQRWKFSSPTSPTSERGTFWTAQPRLLQRSADECFTSRPCAHSLTTRPLNWEHMKSKGNYRDHGMGLLGMFWIYYIYISIGEKN